MLLPDFVYFFFLLLCKVPRILSFHQWGPFLGKGGKDSSSHPPWHNWQDTSSDILIVCCGRIVFSLSVFLSLLHCSDLGFLRSTLAINLNHSRKYGADFKRSHAEEQILILQYNKMYYHKWKLGNNPNPSQKPTLYVHFIVVLRSIVWAWLCILVVKL